KSFMARLGTGGSPPPGAQLLPEEPIIDVVTAVSTNGTARPTARRVFSVPIGCKVSRIDAAALAHRVGGNAPATAPQEADVLLVHGCAVTDRAERDGRRLVRRLRRENPHATLVGSG